MKKATFGIIVETRGFFNPKLAVLNGTGYKYFALAYSFVKIFYIMHRE